MGGCLTHFFLLLSVSIGGGVQKYGGTSGDGDLQELDTHMEEVRAVHVRLYASSEELLLQSIVYVV